MLFAKLLLSPMPHARVTRIDTSAALAMPGVKAILTADELPAPADIVTDLGQTIRANPKGERALTNEPLYEGEPILAVAAVDELHRGRGDREDPDRVRAAAVRRRSAGQPASRTVRTRASKGNVWGRPPAPPAPAAAAARRRRPLEVQELKWTEADFAEYAEGKLPMGKPHDEWSYGDLEAASRTPRSCSTRRS